MTNPYLQQHRRSTSTIKDIYSDEDFKGAELKVSKAFKTKKPAETLPKEDIMIFADYQEKCRHFVKERKPSNVVIFEELASKHKLSINRIMDLYRATSCNMSDLREYLGTKNGDLLWTKDEDQFLRNNENLTLLKAIKGEKRLHERFAYLRDLS